MMNEKFKFLSLIILSNLLLSLCFSNFTIANVSPDQLELTKGSTVNGKVFFDNDTVSGQYLYDSSLVVEDIFNLPDINLNAVQLKISLSDPSRTMDPLGLGILDTFEITSLIFEHNRTTFLPAARMFMKNGSSSVEISILGHGYEDYSEFINLKNVYVTFEDETSYKYGNILPGAAAYPDVKNYVTIYSFFNQGPDRYYKWTLWAISPKVSVEDEINYYNSYTNLNSLGTVLNIASIVSSKGDSFNAIYVQYTGTSLYGPWDASYVNAYYDTRTGLLLKVVETSGGKLKYYFIPDEVSIKGKSLVPFPFVEVIINLVLVGLIVSLLKKKHTK